MSIFRWTAPLFKALGKRWSRDDFRTMAAWLRPHVPPGGVLADLGGGTGELGAGIAYELDARAVIVDTTRQMLQRVDPAPWVSARLASAEALPFPDAYFDALICSDALHHFRDQDSAMREIARVVRPNGAVVILDGFPKGSDRFWAWLERLLHEPAAFLTPEALEQLTAAHGIRGSATRRGRNTYVFMGVRS
jgi:demethylmenaquinone methyltransferase/2-methoxy-6-polyprenyl-1,4-benzoquinol methylase